MANNFGAFFSGNKDDIRGNLYYECCVNPTNPKDPANKGVNGCPCEHLIKARDYLDKQGKRDDDVHPDFITFLKDVGAWHGYLDSNLGSNYRTTDDKIISDWLARINFTPEVTAFFDTFMSPLFRKDINSAWVTLDNDPSGFAQRGMGAINDLRKTYGPQNVRINMKKLEKQRPVLEPTVANPALNVSGDSVGGGGSNIVFANSLPIFAGMDFASVYVDAFNDAQGQSYSPSGSKMFGLQMSKFVQDLLTAQPEEKPDYWLKAELDFDHDAVFRSPNDPNVLMVRNGVTASEADLRKQINAKDNCYTTGLKVNSFDQCNKVITECFLNTSEDLGSCVNAFNSTDLWAADAAVVAKMNPTIAFKILQNLKFMGEMKWDNIAHRKLLKVQSFESWCQTIMSDNSVAQAFKDALKNNKHAIAHYLCLVIDFVNANPAILNKDYVGASDQTSGLPTGADKKDRYGLLPYYVFPGRGDFRALAERVKAKRSRLQLTGSLQPLTLAVGAYPIAQVGGNLAAPLATRRYQMQNCGAKVLSDIYNINLRKLNSQGKDLSQNTKQTIENEIKSLLRTEQKVVDILNFLEKYVRIQNVLRSSSMMVGGGDSTLTMDQIVGDVEEKYADLLSRKERRELNLISILETLIGAVTDGSRVEINMGDKSKFKPLDAKL